jgi:endogenous inhibitor of DNA gyrase (YacG/DUF329 family)
MPSFLDKFKRQPKIYIDLPMAKYYPNGVLDDGQSVSLPVFGMTAADEILLKTPDALFNGEATKEIIKSCIPAIKDPGSMPSLDIDFCLIAIRIATYGPSIELNVTCPKCDTTSKFDLQLQNMLDQAQSKEFDDEKEIEGLHFKFKPLSYNKMTEYNLRNYAFRRQVVGLPEDWSEDQKEEHVSQIMKQMTQANLELILDYIEVISAGDDAESNPEEIKSFISSAETQIYKGIKAHVEKLKSDFSERSIDVKCPECEHEFKSSVDLDYSSFFDL